MGQSPAADQKSIDDVAQLIADYKMAPLSSFALRSEWGQKVMAKVHDINADWSGPEYNKVYTAVKSFATGTQGNQVRAFNVATAHLDTLTGLIDALKGGDVRSVNQAKNAFQTQFGMTAPTNFEAAKQVVADEIAKAVIGGAGALGDRQTAAATLDKANSWDQLMGVVHTYKELMGGQLKGLELQYKTSTHRDDFGGLLTPEAKDAMGRTQAMRGPAGPKVGEVMQGYRFKGGDPSVQSNWEPVPQ